MLRIGFCVVLLFLIFHIDLIAWAQDSHQVLDEIVTSIKEKDLQKTIQSLHKIEEINRETDINDIDAVLQRIVFNEAWLDILEKLYEKTKNHTLIGSQLARCYFQLNRVEEGLLLLNKIVANEPKNPELLHRACILSYSKNQFEPAKRWIDQLLEIEPKHIDALFLKGSILSKEGNYTEARKFLLEVKKLKPNHRLIYFELGLLENLDNHPDAAEQYLRKVIHQQPFYQEAYNQLLLSLSRQKKTKELEKVRLIGAYLNNWDNSKLLRIFELFHRQNFLSPKESLELSIEYCQNKPPCC